MPLSVDIKINGHIIETVWIGRLESLKGADDEHTYACGVGRQYLEAWNLPGTTLEELPTFTHKYSDGARECVRKALEALGLDNSPREE